MEFKKLNRNYIKKKAGAEIRTRVAGSTVP